MILNILQATIIVISFYLFIHLLLQMLHFLSSFVLSLLFTSFAFKKTNLRLNQEFTK